MRNMIIAIAAIAAISMSSVTSAQNIIITGQAPFCVVGSLGILECFHYDYSSCVREATARKTGCVINPRAK